MITTSRQFSAYGPPHRARPGSPTTPSDTDGTPLAVALIVDVDEDFRYILSQMLRPIGYDVVTADNADEACRLAATRLPALIITDLRTCLHDARILPLELRRVPAMQRVPMIVNSSWSQAGDRELARAFGADLFLPTPVDFHAIRDFAASILAART